MAAAAEVIARLGTLAQLTVRRCVWTDMPLSFVSSLPTTLQVTLLSVHTCVSNACKCSQLCSVCCMLAEMPRAAYASDAREQWLLRFPLLPPTGQACRARSWHADILPWPSRLQVANFEDCALKVATGRQATIAALRSAVPQHMHLSLRARAGAFNGFNGVGETFTLERGLAC